jgi:hypothetical protein
MGPAAKAWGTSQEVGDFGRVLMNWRGRGRAGLELKGSELHPMDKRRCLKSKD